MTTFSRTLLVAALLLPMLLTGCKKKKPPVPGTQPAPNKPEHSGTQPSAQISTAMPASQEAQERTSTAQLIQSTESNLRALTRGLTAEEQAMVQQIRNYLNQSRAATTDGD